MFIFAVLKPEKIKISIVNYTNTLPFKWAIKNSPFLEKIDLQEDIPSICAQKLKYKQVDLALVPVALIPELDSYFIETDYCIGANGKVDSVKLYSRVPLEKITNVTLDYQSKTSITLVKVLFKFFWKYEVNFADAKPGFESEIRGDNAAVIIGDRTFGLNGTFPYEYDLAEEWKKFTGLPFIFAAWVSTEKLPQNFILEFNALLQKGVNEIGAAVEESFDQDFPSKAEITNYLIKRIDYRLNEEKRKALDLFFSYIKLL
ncbi:MAG: menaquinone biosynthesis protein [bacterium]|nr:menaquinone biosynthesis protein [bacterium]